MQVVFTNGVVWTGFRTPVGVYTTHALAVNDGRIAALGDAAVKLQSQAETVIDLQGAFLMSAFGDGHAHPLQGGARHLMAPVESASDVAGIVQAVREWADAHPDEYWVRGEGYDPTFAPGGLFDATWLDAAVSDRPVVLRASDAHTAWVNSKALEVLDITAETPDPADGHIVRRPDGTPMGTLKEWGAWRLAYDRFPQPTREQQLDIVRAASQKLNSNGIAWVQDAWVEPQEVAMYIAGLEADALTYRASLALLAEPHKWDGFMDWLRDTCADVADLGDPRLRATTVKFFADGVVEQGTAAMIEEYCDCPGSRGTHVWRPDQLAEAVCEVEAAGFQAHIHAIGDAGVRSALNAFERSLRRNGWRSFPPTITHAQVVNPADLGRFTDLGVVANFQPLWACNDAAMRDLTAPRLGPERTRQQYPIGTLINGGAAVSFGSDWPVSSQSPLLGISVAVTRRDPDNLAGDPFLPTEAIDVESALLAYTNGVAYQAGQHLDWGLLRINGRADLTLLADDPRHVDPTMLGSIAVEGTWLGGQRVWG